MIRLPTSLDQLELRELTAGDAGPYYDLVDQNRAHLSRHGDYAAERDATPAWVAGYFADPPDSNTRFGIWYDEILIGRVDLIPAQPPRYSIGYWLGSAYTGHGYATRACAAAITYARRPGRYRPLRRDHARQCTQRRGRGAARFQPGRRVPDL